MDEKLCEGCSSFFEGMETCMTDCPLDYCDDCGENPCICSIMYDRDGHIKDEYQDEEFQD